MKKIEKSEKEQTKINPFLIGMIFLIIFAIPFSYIQFWNDNINIHQEINETDYKLVEPNEFICNFTLSVHPSSTPRDVVIFYTNIITNRLFLAIQSLRSTGAKCRIVLLVSSDFQPTQKFIKMCELLKVEIVGNCDETKGRNFVPHMLRYEYELEWLKKHSNEISRVFHSDSLDVFFQGDPFTESIPSDSLVFVIEPHCIKMCGWNLAWIEECYGKQIQHQMENHFIICSGSMGGNVNYYIKLLELMLSQKEWETCYSPSKDQPIVNYLVWNGFVDEIGIKYKLTGCENGLFTAQWCIINSKPVINNNSLVTTEYGSIPSFVHQYNRFPEIDRNYHQMCGIEYQQ
ncbi:hypothetical protein TRFO_26997 [Tritrichomonas foetus]|uniref:Nucleotide-diphospho-sugar transferase domain-containing protein n=1 Tax=Tritrichomonas foetus TaxID=1144522 RepID=A0A1J4K6F4_9EUKA|nr:hypothetical protein TRFO_26997 [Tritrichomonas foetus]|eukprot:OHT05300.1 hypothetical protein TRFO_26997 [Tritrichomonas foetus]